MYKIKGWFPPDKEQTMGGWGFSIVLTERWKEAVAKSSINQESIDNLIRNLGDQILMGHGRNYCVGKPTHHLRIKWGEWGPEHISVPGNACGLDIDYSGFGIEKGEVCLYPHNVDHITQASMILCLFLKIADYLESEI